MFEFHVTAYSKVTVGTTLVQRAIEVKRSADQSQVSECLREVSQRFAACAGIKTKRALPTIACTS